MTRIVFCKKYKKDLEGMDTPPYPGDKGQDIFDNVSKQAWEKWLEHQKMVMQLRYKFLINILIVRSRIKLTLLLLND